MRAEPTAMQKEAFHLRINDKHDAFITENQCAELDLVSPQPGVYHILKDGQRYLARLEKLDFTRKAVHLTVNEIPYTIRLYDRYDELVRKMGLTTAVVHKIKDIKAPMPGMVLNIMVSPGQEVAHGDALLVLEAMKMENVIKSPGEGVIKEIKVEKGKAVEKGEVLIELE